MRDDQRQRLEEINELLVDVLLDEADPRVWPGYGMDQRDLSKDERGDRYWSKKNAAMTTVLIGSNLKLIENTKESLGRDPYKEPEMDGVIDRAEAAAAKRIDEIVNKAGYKEFTERARGKVPH